MVISSPQVSETCGLFESFQDAALLD